MAASTSGGYVAASGSLRSTPASSFVHASA